MKIKSKLYLTEKVKNTSPRATANDEYFVAYVDIGNGELHPALFTAFDLEKAMKRAKNNMEDVPKAKVSFWKSLFS